MNWFKSDREIVSEIINSATYKLSERKLEQIHDSLDKAHSLIIELQKEIKRLEFKCDTPKKYKLGQVVNGYTIYEINYLDYEILQFNCFNTPSWQYKGINKQGETITL